MKKIVTLVITLVLAVVSAVMPVKAAEEEERRERTVFETDSFTSREGSYLSVYDGNIREIKNDEWSECNCIGLCYCTLLCHVLEEAPEDDFYSAFFDEDDYIVYLDCSTSMQQAFSYEKSRIMKNLSPFLNEKEIAVEDVFNNKKTDLYGLLKSFNAEFMDEKFDYTCIMPEKTPIIITDLWDTKGEDQEKYRFAGSLIFCVPYASTNKEGVLHCEEIVNDILWNHSLWPTRTAIYLVYTDEVIARYCNGDHNDMEGSIKIYIP